MSDKFFFKGRQDARVNHADQSFQTKAIHKVGTKKYPLELIVTNEKRKHEIELQLSENKLIGNITVDLSKNAVESTDSLHALLKTTQTIKLDKTIPSRNEPCSCGSNKKYKKCCAL